MAKCYACHLEMRRANGCTATVFRFRPRRIVRGKPNPLRKQEKYERIPYGEETLAYHFFDRCGDCHVLRGRLHHPGCDIEQCPRCKDSLLSCGCHGEGLVVVEQSTKQVRPNQPKKKTSRK